MIKLPEGEKNELLEAIAEGCRRAGEIQMRHFRRLASYERKGAIDLLTIADQQSERVLLDYLPGKFPGHRILAEEGSDVGPKDSPWLWVIDPLDGTTNYAHGVPLFGVSIGVLKDGELAAGGVFAPALGELYLAARGWGATRNGDRLSVSRVDTLDDSLIVTGFPYDRRDHLEWLMATFGAFLATTQGVLRLGAAALDLAAVAAGQLEAFYEYNLKPWDMAAGALMVEEAGGCMSTFEGEPFSIWTNRMLSSNGRIHEAMVSVLKQRPFDGGE